MSLLRILFGLITAWQVAIFLLRADLWLSAKGWLSSVCFPVVMTDTFSLLNGVGDDLLLQGFAGLTLVAALCMAAGLCSRIATIVTWVGLTSLQARLNSVLDGGDIVAQFVTFYLALARTGERYSVDNLIRKRRAPAATVPLWPQRLIVFQVSVIYLSAFIHKLHDVCWLDGAALFYALRYTDNQNFWLPGFMRLPPFTNLMAYGTLTVECLLGLVTLLPRFRVPILLAGVGLHLGIAYTMFIPYFMPAMIASYVAFFRGDEVAAALLRLRRRRTA